MNRSLFKIFGLIAVFTFLYSTITSAQYTPAKKKTYAKKNDKYFDESNDFVHHLQYGIHLNSNVLSFSSNNFGFGLSPSVGYKFNKTFMAGLTTGFDYNYQRYFYGTQAYTFTPIDFNYGAYGRIRFFNSPIYLYTDLKNATYQIADTDSGGNIILNPNNPNKINTRSQTRPESNLGLVYRGGNGSGWGTEFVVTYNVLSKVDDYRPSPFDVKIGFTYNF